MDEAAAVIRRAGEGGQGEATFSCYAILLKSSARPGWRVAAGARVSDECWGNIRTLRRVVQWSREEHDEAPPSKGVP